MKDLKLDKRGRVRFTVEGVRFEVSLDRYSRKPSVKIYFRGSRAPQGKEESILGFGYTHEHVLELMTQPDVLATLNDAVTLVDSQNYTLLDV